MKRIVILFTLAVVLFFATGQLNAQILFQAFTGDEPIPKDAENPDRWNEGMVTKGKNIYQVADGRLKQVANDCANSTKTVFPVKGDNWTDYTVILDVWSRDNDAFAILFRYTDDNKYYNFAIGASDHGNQWFLADSGAAENACYGNAAGLGTGNNGLNIDESGNTPYTMMVRVEGSKIEVFFGEQVSQEDVLAGKTPPKLGEADDDNHEQGTVGLYFGSNPADLANIYVLGPGGFAVDAREKLPILWGQLKSAY